MAKNTLLLVFHPHLESGSRANKRLADAARDLDNVTVRDEYALYPDFSIDVKAEQKALLKAERVVWQFPFYWYSTPALLKQREDLVLEHDWAYGHDGDKLHGKELQPASPSVPTSLSTRMRASSTSPASNCSSRWRPRPDTSA